MANTSDAISKKPSKLWWLLGVVLFVLFLFVQLPVSWLVARFAPNQPYIESISGNLWHGQAQWRVPEHITPAKRALSGSLNWQWRPWELLWLQMGSDVTVKTGNTALDARLGVKKNGLKISDVNGTLAGTTIRDVFPFQWPATDITVKEVTLHAKKNDGKTQWTDAEGLLIWPGGQIGYPTAGKTEIVDLPALKNTISLEKEKLHFALVNDADERMGDIYLDADNMLDVQLTQRLLLNVKGYQGNAALDTAVISVRQPLASIGQ